MANFNLCKGVAVFNFQLFLCPLRVSCLLPDTVLSAMFANIEAILAINMELVIAMREMSVGNAFLRLAPFLRLYSLYANNFQRANQLVLVRTFILFYYNY